MEAGIPLPHIEGRNEGKEGLLVGPGEALHEGPSAVEQPAGNQAHHPEAGKLSHLVGLFHIVPRPIENRMNDKSDTDDQGCKDGPHHQ